MGLYLGTVSYGIAAFLLLLLIIAQQRVWITGKSSSVLLVATAISLFWALALSLRGSVPLGYFYLLQLLEILKNVAWFALLLSILGVRKVFFRRYQDGTDLRSLVLVTAIALGLPALLAFRITFLEFAGNAALFLPGFGGRDVIVGFLLVAVAGLALLEQVVRNTRSHNTWHLKFLWLSLGVLFTYDIYLFSNALLFDRIQMQLWEIRGVVVALTTPLLAISVLRTRDDAIQMKVSRRLVFHSGVLIAAGLYLLLMALAGVYLRQFSGEWGLVLQVVFWVISLTLLAVLAYSGRIRSSVKLYINRHLFSSKYDYRDEWMRISNTLSHTSVDESLPERVIRALADIVDSPGGALWLSSNDSHFDQIAHLEMGWSENSVLTRDDVLISHLEAKGEMIDLTDLDADLSEDDLPAWMHELGKAWLLIPLLLNGRLLGFVLLKESRVEFDLNWEDYELMNAAGQQAASYLAQMVASEALTEAQQFSAFNQVSAFVVHDLKTLNSQLSLMVKNAEKHKSNPSFVEDMIKTTEHAVNKMSMLLKHFRSSEKTDENESQAVDLVPLLQQVVAAQSKLKPCPELTCDEESVVVLGDEEQLRSSVVHLVQNAQEATPDDGQVGLILSREGELAQLKIKDTGAGMTREFITTRLFHPFESTKGLTGMGLGVFQCRTTIRQFGGEIFVRSEVGKGTEFTIRLPVI